MKAPASPLLAGTVLQRLRITSGLILFAFVLTHFLNHALGLWSLDVMEVVQSWRTAVTRSTVGTIVLAGAFLTHFVLNLTKLALQIHLADADLGSRPDRSRAEHSWCSSSTTPPICAANI